MAFRLEQALLRLVLDEENQATRVGRFVPTHRNAPAARDFPDNGFCQANARDWLLEDRQQGRSVPVWITMGRRS